MNVGHRGARLVEPTGKSQRQRRYRTDMRMCIRTGGGLHAPLRGCLEIAGPYQRQGCSTLSSSVNGRGESEMPHADANCPVIANWGFRRRGAV